MSERVYVETSVISYLCAPTSRDLVVAANQEVTREWWERERKQYEVYVSVFVIEEIGAGDADAARRRLAAVQNIPILAVNDTALAVSVDLMKTLRLPVHLADDIAHIAVAAAHGMDFLITWNCAHIANPRWQSPIRERILAAGLSAPTICTPQTLLEGEPT